MRVGNFSIHLINALSHELNIDCRSRHINIQTIANGFAHVQGLQKCEFCSILINKICKLHHDSHAFSWGHFQPRSSFITFFSCGHCLVYIFLCTCSNSCINFIGCWVNNFELSTVSGVHVFTINKESAFNFIFSLTG